MEAVSLLRGVTSNDNKIPGPDVAISTSYSPGVGWVHLDRILLDLRTLLLHRKLKKTLKTCFSKQLKTLEQNTLTVFEKANQSSNKLQKRLFEQSFEVRQD